MNTVRISTKILKYEKVINRSKKHKKVTERDKEHNN